MPFRKIILLLFLLSTTLFSQITDLNFERINTNDGIPMNSVVAITQDHLGFMWFGTASGLVRYDGYNFDSIEDSTELSKLLKVEEIRFIKQDSNNNLWIGTTNSGLFKYLYDENKLSQIRYLDQNGDLLFEKLALDVEFIDEKVWISTYDEGLILASINSCQVYKHFKNVNSDNNKTIIFKELFFDERSKLWVSTSQGLFRLDENDEFVDIAKIYYPDYQNKYSYVNTFFIDSKKNLWIHFYEKDFLRVNLNKREWINYSGKHKDYSKIPSLRIVDILETPDGDIWFANLGYGVLKYSYKNDKITRYVRERKSKSPFESHSSLDLHLDRDNILWISSMTHGIYKVDKYKSKFKHLKFDVNNDNSLTGANVWDMEEDEDGSLWICTESGITQYYPKENKFYRHLENHSPSQPMYRFHIITLLIEKDRVWFGTAGAGLYEFNKKTKEMIIHSTITVGDKTTPIGQIGSIVRDNQYLWFSSMADGITRFNTKTKEFAKYNYKHQDSTGLMSNFVTKIIKRRNGEIWLSFFKGGISRYDKEKNIFEKHFIESKNLDKIITIYEDSNSNLWAGSIHSGLFLFNDNTNQFTSFNNPEENNYNNIKSIIEDDIGNLWIGSDAGVSKFNLETKSYINYSDEEGFEGGFVIYRATGKDRAGKIYFGSPEGINIIDPKNLKDNTTKPEVIITKIIAHNSDEKIDILKMNNYEFSYDNNNLSVQLMIPQYSRTNNHKYFFKFSSDDKWFRLENNMLTLHNLEPGHYKLQFVAENSDGIRGDKFTEFELIISPPFYQTLLFNIIVGLIVLLVIYLIYKKRVEFIEKRKTELEERIIEREEAADKLSKAYKEVDELKNKLIEENTYLQSEINLDHNFSDFICKAGSVKAVLQKVEQVASSDTTTLITGETGTGKELIARSIHNLSLRRDRALVKVNCASLPDALIESELFGHEKGAFTGAINRKKGRFELADKGTIFLDEIGELPIQLQSKLLRVLQEGEFEPLGSTKTIKVDVRIIAATNRNLLKEIANGNFREDLFFRLNVFPLELPPLRERKEDIPLLVNHFIQKYGQKIGKEFTKISSTVIDRLFDYNWPGNIRELENVIERAVILSNDKKLKLDESFFSARSVGNNGKDEILDLEELERKHIIKILEKTNWQVSGENGAAKILNVKAPTLVSKIKKLNIENPYKPKK